MNLWPFSKQPSLATPWILTPEGASPLDEFSPIHAEFKLDSPRLIIPRQYLFYIYVDLGAVPLGLRENLIQQRLQQLSPFAQSASWIVQEEGRAQIWFWDANLVPARAAQIPALPKAAIPEALLLAPFTQGFRLQACLSGWELQYWDEGCLRQSLWLSARPDARAQADFARNCGYRQDQAVWVDADLALLPGPWDEKPFWSRATLLREPLVTRLIAGLLLVWVTLELGMDLGTQFKSSWLSSSVAAQSESMEGLVNQRDAALRQQEFNRAITQLVAAPSPLFLAAQVNQCLAGFDLVILDWQYQRGQLVAVLQKEGLDTRALIEACAANPVFTDVRVEPGLTPDQTRVLFSLPGAVNKEDGDA